MLIKDLVPLFLEDRGRSVEPKTLSFYTSRLSGLIRRLGERDIRELTLKDVLEHLRALNEEHRKQHSKELSNSTQRHNIVALAQLQQFAIDQGILKDPIFTKLKKPPVGQRNRLPTDAETAALLKSAGPEFKTIYSALRQCGARPGELCRATIADLDRTEGDAKIILAKHKTAKKTGRPRVIPIGGKLLALILGSIGDRTEGPIFISPRGTAWQVNNLSATYRKLRDKAGLPKDLVLYLARHECGTRLARLNLKIAQDTLGHTSITTTQRYIHLQNSELAKAQDEAG